MTFIWWLLSSGKKAKIQETFLRVDTQDAFLKRECNFFSSTPTICARDILGNRQKLRESS